MEIPEGMIAEKLRFIATYVDECDSIIGKLLRRAKDQGFDIAVEYLEMTDGKEVQADLRRWAEDLDAQVMAREAVDRLAKTVLAVEHHCVHCGIELGGGPGGWFAKGTGAERCNGPSPTDFHEVG